VVKLGKIMGGAMVKLGKIMGGEWEVLGVRR